MSVIRKKTSSYTLINCNLKCWQHFLRKVPTQFSLYIPSTNAEPLPLQFKANENKQLVRYKRLYPSNLFSLLWLGSLSKVPLKLPHFNLAPVDEKPPPLVRAKKRTFEDSVFVFVFGPMNLWPFFQKGYEFFGSFILVA